MNHKSRSDAARRVPWAMVFPVAIVLIALTLVLWHFVQRH